MNTTPPSPPRRTGSHTPTTYAVIGLVVNLCLVIVKIGGGILGNSFALVADGVESIADIFASAVVWRGVRVASRSPDEGFPFGYGKAESVAASIVAIFMIAAALGIFVQAALESRVPHGPPESFALGLLVGVVIVKGTLARWVETGSGRHRSAALSADAWHHRADAITSGAAFVGIGVAVLGGPAWAVADEYAAMIASVVILLNGSRILHGAARDLMDAAPGPEVADRIRTRALSVPGVRSIDKVLVRRMGAGFRIVLHVEADGDLPLRDAHELGGRVRQLLRREDDVIDVVIHMEPWDEPATPPPPPPPGR